MRCHRPALSFGIVFVAGLTLGWISSGGLNPKPLLANGADRWGERALTSGPITIESAGDDKHPISIPQDALYYLNYSTGKLFATVPSVQQTSISTRVHADFAERDLITDFGIKPGTNPHFLMTTANLGFRNSGWAPLFVVETETGQVATYKVTLHATATNATRPQFQLIDRRVDRRLGKVLTEETRP